MRMRLLLAASILAIAVSVAARGAAGRLSGEPVEYTVALKSVPWTAALDEQSGQIFVVSRSLAAAGVARMYAFSSAGSYGFAVNGAAVGTRIGGNVLPSPDTISLVARGSRLAGPAVPVAADPGTAAVDSRDGLLYVTSEDENLVEVLDSRRMRPLRSVTVGTRPTALAVSAATNRVFVVNAGDGTVSMLDSRTGNLLRTVQVPNAGDFAGIAVDARRARVYVAGQGLLSVLDARNSALVRTVALLPPGQATRRSSALAVYGGAVAIVLAVPEAARIYVLEAGTLCTVDAVNYRVLYDVPTGAGVTAAAVDPGNDSIIVARNSPQSRLQVLDPRSGATRRTFTLDAAPVALALDERSSRLLVVGQSVAHAAADPWWWLPGGLRRLLSPVPKPRSAGQVQGGIIAAFRLTDLTSPS